MVEVLEIPFKQEYIPEISTLLGKEYLVSAFLNHYKASNQCFKALNLKEDQLIREFEKYFQEKKYRYLVLLVDKKLYEQGKISFVSIVSGGDLLDFFPKGALNYENNVDFDQVPTIEDFRAYMRYKSLKPLWEKYKPIQDNYHSEHLCSSIQFIKNRETPIRFFILATKNYVHKAINT